MDRPSETTSAQKTIAQTDSFLLKKNHNSKKLTAQPP